MTDSAQRRFYRLNIAGATCFLMGVLLSQTGGIGVANFQLYLACILVFAGLVLCFKPFDTGIHPEDIVDCPSEEAPGSEEDVKEKKLPQEDSANKELASEGEIP